MQYHKMKDDEYLGIISELIEKDLLFEKGTISKFVHSKEISENEIIKKEVRIKKALVLINLENGDHLLVKDTPMNFFLSYTIIIGENARLCRFKFKDRFIICERSLLNEIIDEKTGYEEIRPKDLYKLKFSTSYNIPKILREIKDYIMQTKGIDLDSIHIDKGSEITNFTPTIKYEHIRLAKLMSIPIEELIEDSFIIDTGISVYDVLTQIEKLRPLRVDEEKEIWEFDRKNHNMVYRDMSFHYYLRNDMKINKEKIESLSIKRKEKDRLLRLLRGISELKISTDNQGQILPLWKVRGRQEFLNIKDKQGFRKLSGIDFRLEKKFLKDIYLQDEHGEKAKMKEKYIEEDILNYMEKGLLNKKIEFENEKDLLIQLTLNKKPTSIVEKNVIDKEKVTQINTFLQRLTKTLFTKSVELNTFTKQQEPFTLSQIALESLKNIIIRDTQRFFKGEKSAKELFEMIYNKSLFLYECSKAEKIGKDDIFFFIQTTYSLIQAACELDRNGFHKTKEIFEETFDDFAVEQASLRIDETSVELYESIIRANLLSRNQEVFVFPKKEFDTSLLDKNIEIKRALSHKRFIKADMNILKKNFPYTFEQVASKIEENPSTSVIEIEKRKIPVREDFYHVHYEFPGFKTILENKYFSVLAIKETD